MASEKKRPIEEALGNLSSAIEGYQKKGKHDPLPLLALTKAFEVAVEYAWRSLKKRVEDEGLDCPSPKAAVREAAKLGFISDPALYLKTIEARNASVHDYFGISTDEFVRLAQEFTKFAKKDLRR